MSSSGSMSRTSTPPMRTAPAETSQKRATRLATVDFPAPDGPTRAQVVPSGTERLTPSRASGASFSPSAPYENDTPSSSTSKRSGTRADPGAGAGSAGMPSTSSMRERWEEMIMLSSEMYIILLSAPAMEGTNRR